MGPRQVRCKEFSVIRRVKKSEAINGIHVRMAAIPSEMGDLARWRLVNMEVNQHERYDGFADTQDGKCFPCRWQEQQVNVTQLVTILDGAIACFHTDMDDLIHAHPPRETKPGLEQGEPHYPGRSTFAMKFS